MIIEIVKGNLALYCRAEVPTEHIKDVKAMKIEADTANDGHETPEDLYNAVPVMTPMDKG